MIYMVPRWLLRVTRLTNWLDAVGRAVGVEL